MSHSLQVPVRVAILGCGRAGQSHLQCLLQEPRATLALCVDPDQRHRELVAQRVGASVKLAATFDPILVAREAEAVVVASPTSDHYEQVKACLAEGLHVLCEKPLATERWQILELIELSFQRRRVLSVAFQRRGLGAYRTMKQWLQDGRVGKPLAVAAITCEPWRQANRGTWRDDPHKNPGGYLVDHGSHKVDLLTYLLGSSPATVWCQTSTRGMRVPAQASVVAQRDDGVLVSMFFDGAAPYWEDRFAIHGEDAALLYESGRLLVAYADTKEAVPSVEPDCAPVRWFVDALLGTGPNLAPPDCALDVLDFLNAALRSARIGSAVATLPLE